MKNVGSLKTMQIGGWWMKIEISSNKNSIPLNTLKVKSLSLNFGKPWSKTLLKTL